VRLSVPQDNCVLVVGVDNLDFTTWKGINVDQEALAEMSKHEVHDKYQRVYKLDNEQDSEQYKEDFPDEPAKMIRLKLDDLELRRGNLHGRMDDYPTFREVNGGSRKIKSRKRKSRKRKSRKRKSRKIKSRKIKKR